MLCKINRGPHFGETHHFPKSQETNALILLGDLEPIEQPVDLVERSRRTPQHPPAGWGIVYEGLERKPLIVHRDGSGGKTLYDKPPGPTRQWFHNPETGEEGYRMVPSDCPPEVIAEFQMLTGDGMDDVTKAALRQQERNNIDAQMAAQTSSGHRLY